MINRLNIQGIRSFGVESEDAQVRNLNKLKQIAK